ncbi:sensor histidine kinase [Vagococcus vulneris]|nr:sensor histidine kinase [Vagococcus vulneris]
MNFLKYLSDQLHLFLIWILLIITTGFVLWLTPKESLDMSVMIYIVLIGVIIIFIYFLTSYQRKKRWWNRLEKKSIQHLDMEHLTNAHSYEEKFYQTCINNIQDDFIWESNHVNKQSKEHQDFINGWVHEIKIPLASFNLLVDAVEYDIPDDKFLLFKDNLQRMNDYVEQVMYYSRLDSFSKDYLISSHSLLAIVQSVVKRSANYFIQNHIKLELADEDANVLTDEKWLHYIINQIISNSLKYTEAGGTIHIEINKDDRGTLLSISDTGIGIPTEELQRIFDKGFTGSNGRNKQTNSTGLGLYLANNLAKKLGHHLIVTSEVNEGTKVSILFPTLGYYSDNDSDFLDI